MSSPVASSLREQTAGLASLALEEDLDSEINAKNVLQWQLPSRDAQLSTSSNNNVSTTASQSAADSEYINKKLDEITEVQSFGSLPAAAIVSEAADNSGVADSDSQGQENRLLLPKNSTSCLPGQTRMPKPTLNYRDYGSMSDQRTLLPDFHSADEFSNRSSHLDPKFHQRYPSFNGRREPLSIQISKWAKHLNNWALENVTSETLVTECIIKPIKTLPSVVLGTLLNILDGLSYGIILFPLTHPIFSNLGPAGLSMFYVSCIISQLVYSLGGSAFHSGVGSEMIEVVPFFHSMAASLIREIGEENPKSVIATTILAFSLSSIVTGLVFFTLGYAKLGALVGFFPRHILVGCIGGVGWFLIVTAIEVSSRIDDNIKYDWDTFKFLFFNGINFLHWILPLGLALLLLLVQKFSRNPLLVPSYFIAVFVIFHIVVLAIPSLSYTELRDLGWMFQAPAADEPWWQFYTLYDFKAVDYLALLHTVPAMFALTFFGILHVPINVPALAASIGEDKLDIDRELLAHGISNALSGLFGSIQNYLVYANSVMFIRSGADSRLSGVMLAAATFGAMVAGPDIIGFIPVMVVGAMIFLLGVELIMESLVETWGRVSRFEYLTIIAIVVTMGTIDFVTGIVVGILLACVSMVIQASQRSAIKGAFTGVVARSTVRRNQVQQRFLTEVGDQIFVLKLGGNIFFGTIVRIERAVRSLLDDEYFDLKPIRYLVLDMSTVSAIDFSAAEAFMRMKRMLDTKAVFMLIAGAGEDGAVIKSLRAVGLLNSLHANPACYQDEEEGMFAECEDDYESSVVRLFHDLNSALEWSENQFLKDYYRHREALKRDAERQLDVPRTASTPAKQLNMDAISSADTSTFNRELARSPRVAFLQQVVDKTVHEDPQVSSVRSKWHVYKQPLPLLMQTFQTLTNQRETFWFKVAAFFRREEIAAGTVLYKSDAEATGFYIVESGILRADYDLKQGQLYETILAGTTCGELPFFSQTSRTATVKAETNAVVWNLDKEAWAALKAQQPDGPEMAMELYSIALKLTVERFTSVMAYILISANR